MFEKDILKVLYSKEKLAVGVKKLGQQLTKEYQDKNPLVVCILKGAMPFMTDLIREINAFLEMDFMVVSSYVKATSSGEVKILKDLDTNVEGRDILLVEDIIDTGRTLRYLVDLFKYRQANSVKVVALLDKSARRVVEVNVDYVIYTAPDEFLVGYGLDYNEKYRNLPYIGILKPEIYQN
ncbi:MAG: hypoxanthine phosphoribosyltransferase [Lactobacillales bacterium]|jgi:hypoxanthine phosphoribosyltransferase|nr:hypoxanthine phosphoribosyltransferase [Lactobacillales bacterium]